MTTVSFKHMGNRYQLLYNINQLLVLLLGGRNLPDGMLFHTTIALFSEISNTETHPTKGDAALMDH